MRSKHPRSPALHGAAEAAGLQGAFFELVDSLYADRGHVDDPHLWRRVEDLGLDLERFEIDRRSEEVAARVRRDFESGLRGGVAGTPAFFDAAGRSAARPIALPFCGNSHPGTGLLLFTGREREF